MKPSTIVVSVITLLMFTQISPAQTQVPLKNVARLCTAFVYANSANGAGGEQDSPFYGGRNAFDDGQNVVNNIHYSSWSPGKESDWIRLRFAQDAGPLSVEAITIEANESEYSPESVRATISHDDGKEEQLPVVHLTNPLTTINLPSPVSNVSAIRLDFQAKQNFQITEIQVMGQPSHGCQQTAGTPNFDEEYKKQLVASAKPKGSTGGASQDSRINLALREMKGLYAQLYAAQNDQAKADAWLNLNRRADELAKLLTELQNAMNNSGPPTPVEELDRIAEKTKTIGISLNFCEIGNDWAADPTGYENYLKLLPSGANADEASWKSKVEPSTCGDFEGSVEEFQQGISTYRGFIERFPSSTYIERAKSQLAGYESGLREAQAQQQKANPSHN